MKPYLFGIFSRGLYSEKLINTPHRFHQLKLVVEALKITERKTRKHSRCVDTPLQSGKLFAYAHRLTRARHAVTPDCYFARGMTCGGRDDDAAYDWAWSFLVCGSGAPSVSRRIPSTVHAQSHTSTFQNKAMPNLALTKGIRRSPARAHIHPRKMSPHESSSPRNVWHFFATPYSFSGGVHSDCLP